MSLLRCGPLSEASKLKKYMMVRKGKALLVRALRLLDEENMKVSSNWLWHKKYNGISKYFVYTLYQIDIVIVSDILQHAFFTIHHGSEKRQR